MEVLGLTEGKEAEQPTVDVSHIVDQKKKRQSCRKIMWFNFAVTLNQVNCHSTVWSNHFIVNAFNEI